MNAKPTHMLFVAVALSALAAVLASSAQGRISEGTGTVRTAPAVVSEQQAAEPDHRCYGELMSGINTTWPWAHFDKDAFPPPPGAIALWVQLFGSDIGVDSVRELQLLFCGE